MKSVLWLGLLLTSGVLSGGVLAQSTLTDPTRPPLSMGESALDPNAVSGPVLQAVIISKKGSSVAVIGGQQVRLGGMYGDSRLVRLTEREAVLDGPLGLERLQLTPGIKKASSIMKESPKTPVAKAAQRGSMQ